jgi:predicted enzyme related to lactoylglutathione lyase
VHFALYPAPTPGRAPERRSAGSSFPGVYVESLDDALRQVEAVVAPILTGHEVMPWGCRFVAEDPDGRAVEVNEKCHCNVPDGRPDAS